MQLNLSLKNHYIDLSSILGLVSVSGPDAAALLQGQLTCNVTEITPNQSQLGALCNVKGRIQASFRLFMHQSVYYLLVPYAMRYAIVETLSRYAMFYKTQVEVVGEKWHMTGLTGAFIDSYLTSLAIPLPAREGVFTQKETLFLAIPSFKSHNRLLCLSKTPLELSEYFTETSAEFWILLDICAGIPSVYPQTQGVFTPHQINYPALGGVSFKKGCYTGQEIVARMEHLGQFKNQMVPISFSGHSTDNLHIAESTLNTINTLFPPGTPIEDTDAKPQGTLVMAASMDSTNGLGLACIHAHSLSKELFLKNLPIEIIQQAD